MVRGWSDMARSLRSSRWLVAIFAFAATALMTAGARASEADLVMPKLDDPTIANFLGGMTGHTLLLIGLAVCVLGGAFGLVFSNQLKKLPVHKSMLEISELIYATCKTYIVTQGKFILVLFLFIGAVIVTYLVFQDTSVGHIKHAAELAEKGIAVPGLGAKVVLTLLFALVGIAGSYGVAWFGIRINTYANSRSAFAALRGKPFPTYAIPLKAGMSIGMLLISVELVMMLAILLFIPSNLAGICFLGFAVGESLGATALRIAGGIITKIADIGSDLMKIVFNIKEDDARNPGVIADCTGDNAGDSVGP